MKNLLFIFNPLSGKSAIKMNICDILDIFTKSGYRIAVHPTQNKLDASEQIMRYGHRYDLIVCSGGDGTLNETISGVMELDAKPPIGYIPSGSTNDFASGVRLPKRILAAARIAIKGKPYAIDIGSFNHRYFSYIAAFGAFTEVSYMTSQELKNLLGHQAYLLEALKKITSLKPVHMNVRCGNKIIQGDYLYGMVTNSFSVGGFKGLTGKNVVLDDGYFEVTLIRQPKNAVDLNMIFSSLIGWDVKTSMVCRFKARKVFFESEKNVPWVLDGEFGGSIKKVVIKNNHKAIQVKSGFIRGNIR